MATTLCTVPTANSPDTATIVGNRAYYVYDTGNVENNGVDFNSYGQADY